MRARACASATQAYLTVFNDKLYFQGVSPDKGIELWVYNGTQSPSLLYDIEPGSGDGQPVSVQKDHAPSLSLISHSSRASRDRNTYGWP